MMPFTREDNGCGNYEGCPDPCGKIPDECELNRNREAKNWAKHREGVLLTREMNRHSMERREDK